MTNFYNLYEFMNMVSYYIEHQDTEHLSLKGISFFIHTLKYTFPCHMSSRKEELRDRRLYGTGGQLVFEITFFVVWFNRVSSVQGNEIRV